MLRSVEDHVHTVLHDLNQSSTCKAFNGPNAIYFHPFCHQSHTQHNRQTALQINITPGNNLKALASFGSQSESADNMLSNE